MATESPVSLIGSGGARNWLTNKDSASFTSSVGNAAAQDVGMFFQGHGFHGSRSFSGPNRSGSAPPSMEGSSLAIGDLRGLQNSSLEGIFENISNAVESSEPEEQLRADPAYLAYYYSNVNLNPRLPQPLGSRENRHLVHHVGALGENWRMSSFDDSNKGSSFMSRPVLSPHKEEPEDDRPPNIESDGKEESNSGFVSGSGSYTPPLQGRHKSLVDLIQEDFPRTPSPVYNNQSRSSSHGTAEQADVDACINPFQDSLSSITKVEPKTSTVGVRARTPIPGAHSVGSKPSDDLALSRSLCTTSSDVKVAPRRGQKGESSTSDDKVDNGVLSSIGNIENETRNLRISNDGPRSQPARQHPQQNSLHSQSSFQIQFGQSQMAHQGMPSSNSVVDHFSPAQIKLPSADAQPVLQSSGVAPPLYATAAAYGTPYYPNVQPSSLFPPQFNMGGYALNTSLMPPFIAGYSPYSSLSMPFENAASPNLSTRTSGVSTGGSINPVADMQHLYKFYGHFGVATQPFSDPLYMPYIQQSPLDAYASVGQFDPVASRGGTIVSPHSNYDFQRGLPPTAQSPDQRPQTLRTGAANIPAARKGVNGSPNYPANPPSVAVLMHYPSSPLASPAFQGSPVAGTSLSGRRNENMRFPISPGRTGCGAYSGWQGQRGRDKVEDQKPHSFLDELKSSKSRRYELSDIAGRVVKFSADQHGSRFIQQKLETCNAEEKASVFEEVHPHASALMTDVFGNYVIQKFFEHGTPQQRKELANKLVGHILQLSLQMYGCRVIQKALEVIELDQKTQLVRELDGHVMRCVRDQNGNHVIQKCIECVPTEKIDFIISAFRGNVAMLSMHPYGCRVIQRVLEHCTDELQSQCIVDEILQSACILAQDQYGNYVTQHVLERGKPLERSQIISKLAGQIVQMSQHKFASNVIEKCLEHGSTSEREILIEEIVGQTEGNDNLLVMMKDQFANYVVQKILETCNDKQREILLGRIRVHLQALKKYTYGKHIVARVEQLSGEEPDALES